MSVLTRTLTFLVTITALLAAAATSAHGQSAPVITGFFQQDGSCTPPPSPLGYYGDGSASSIPYYAPCGTGFDSTLTVRMGNDPELALGEVYNGTMIALIGAPNPTTSPVPSTVDMTLCNQYGCTVYPNAWTWYTDWAYPTSVTPNVISETFLQNVRVYGFNMQTTESISVCGQLADIQYEVDDFGDPPYLDTNVVRFTAPAYAGGPTLCDVTVISAQGVNTLGASLTYVDVSPPTLSSVSPAQGPVSGGTVVTIHGALLGEGDSVTFDGIPATDVTISGHNSITATVPASVSGAHSAVVAITGPNGTGSFLGAFVYGSLTGVFVADTTAGVGALDGDGVTKSPATAGGGKGVLVDKAGYVWSLDAGGNGISRFNSLGVLANDFTGLSLLNQPIALATDGAGLIWIANSGTLSITAVNTAGASVQSAVLATDSLSSAPSAVAVDEAGGLWVVSKSGNQVTHIIGAASPVVTPIANGVANGTLGKKP